MRLSSKTDLTEHYFSLFCTGQNYTYICILHSRKDTIRLSSAIWYVIWDGMMSFHCKQVLITMCLGSKTERKDFMHSGKNKFLTSGPLCCLVFDAKEDEIKRGRVHACLEIYAFFSAPEARVSPLPSEYPRAVRVHWARTHPALHASCPVPLFSSPFPSRD